MDNFFGEIQAGSKSKATIDNYKRREKKFFLWLKTDSPDCWDNNTDILPCLTRVTTEIMCKFISVQSIHAITRNMKSYSTPEGHHSMLVNLFSRLKSPFPESFEEEWNEFAKGYKNKIAENISAGLMPAAGTDRITFEDYKKLTLFALQSEKFYAHSFLVLAWNLMTRSGSTGDVKYEHLRMNGDHIIVIIPRHKGDRSGEKPTEKSLYSNPTSPQICPFLALGIVLLSREIYKDCDSIILGKKTDENINIWLRSVSAAAVAGASGAIVGVNGSHLTSHCTRKGSTSYVVSLPGLSNVIACWLRAGWQLGGVLPAYIAVESGGDQTVGRSVCGLPPGDLDFTLLPARFRPDANVIWSDIVANYDLYPVDFQLVIPYLVAAVVHHAMWVSENLPTSHPVFLGRCWRSGAQVSLKSLVLEPCRMRCIHSGMVATGVPPIHIFMNQHENSSLAIMTAITNNSRAAEPRSALDIRFDKLESLMQEILQASLNSATVSSSAASSASSTSDEREVTRDLPLTWTYGGKLRRVPEGFRLVTKMSLQTLYQLWHEGMKSERIGPFKYLDGHDVHKDDRKHLSSAKALVVEIDKFLPSGFLNLSSSDRDAAFKVAFGSMATSFQDNESEGNLKRKPLENFSYTTLYTTYYLPTKKKRSSTPAATLV